VIIAAAPAKIEISAVNNLLRHRGLQDPRVLTHWRCPFIEDVTPITQHIDSTREQQEQNAKMKKKIKEGRKKVQINSIPGDSEKFATHRRHVQVNQRLIEVNIAIRNNRDFARQFLVTIDKRIFVFPTIAQDRYHDFFAST
jgi:hypothetical protein